MLRPQADACWFSGADILYAQAWAWTISAGHWWLVVEARHEGNAHAAMTVVAPGDGLILRLRVLGPGDVEASRGSGVVQRHRLVRAALHAFRRPTPRDLAAIGAMLARTLLVDGEPVQQGSFAG